MLYRMLVCSLLLTVISGTCFAQDVRIEAEARYWFPDLDSEVKYQGTQFDVKDDLGLRDEDFPEARITWHTGPNSRLRLDYTQISYSGDQTLNRLIIFDNQAYNVGTRVTTDFDLQYLRLGWIWQFINFFDDKVKLGTVLDLKALMIDLKLDAPAVPLSENEDFIGGLPTIGLACEINPIKKLNIFAEFSGLTAGDYGYFFDAEAGIRFIPVKNFSISGGYRMFKIKIEDDPDLAQVEISGPFIGASLRF